MAFGRSETIGTTGLIEYLDYGIRTADRHPLRRRSKPQAMIYIWSLSDRAIPRPGKPFWQF
jgi:hypothetical protein